jgi:beta-lactamase class A
MLSERENELRHLLESSSNAQVSLAICDLASGFQLLVHSDVPFHPASTFKVGVMMEVFHQASDGSSPLMRCCR